MKKMIGSLLGAAMLVAASLQIHAQGFIYDQQSATSPAHPVGNGNVDGLDIQSSLQPNSFFTQAFVPTFSAIGFVQFEFEDVPNNGTNGATVYFNLWTGSPNTNSATFLGSTTPVYMPDGFVTDNLLVAGVTNFYFSTPIALTSGQTYYLQPVVLSGDNPWAIVSLDNNTYLGGGLYFSGVQSDDTSLWFREGIIAVPEPSTLALIGVSSLFIFARKRFRNFLIIGSLFVAMLVHAQVYYVQSLGGVGSPPFPIDPDHGAYPVEEVSPGVFLIEDGSSVGGGRFHSDFSSFPLLGGTNDSGTNYFQSSFTPQVFGSNDLWLSIISATNGITQLTIHPPWDVDINNTNWDLFYTTNLATPYTNWWWILRTDLGQTNLAVANAIDDAGFYALGHADENGRPQANGNELFPCPNTPTLVSLQPQDPSYTYTILTYPTNGVLSGTPPNLTYTATICSGGVDSFIFKVNDGTNDSAPATVNFYIYADNLHANPVNFQICRGMSNTFSLDGGNCGNTANYYLLSLPAHGILSGSLPILTYTATNSDFTGTDSFDYVAYDNCGYATNTVTVTVGDPNINVGSQILVSTNQPVNITLSTADPFDACIADTNDYVYTITGALTNGYLSGTPPNLTYTPTNGDGVDSFQFTASDGVWTSTYPATITIYTVTAGPILSVNECNPFGTAVELVWSLDAGVSNLWQQEGLGIRDFIVSRATNSGGPYTPIYTDLYPDTAQTNYLDTTAVPGQTYYYVVNFESYESGTYYESPYSNEVGASGQTPDNLISADAVWQVVTNLADPSHVVSLQAPFSSSYPNQYGDIYPLPNTYWPVGSEETPSVWTNRISLYIPTNVVDLSQVQYSIAIDNDYQLDVNGAHTDWITREGEAQWSAFQSLPNIHQGTNDIVVVIRDRDIENYFSLVVTTNTCGQ